jgi:predicted esterase
MSDTKLHHITTSKTGRYYTLGEINDQTRDIWLVLHGYGQLAEYFIRNFKNIHHTHNFVVAPEALSRFYLNETTGRTGATWMTKEDREYEIEDYIRYLDQIIHSLNIPKNIRLHVLGFSQGAATACRWALNTLHPVKTLICWAGFFPPDMKWDSPKYLDGEMKTYLLYGNMDEYVNDEMKKQIESKIQMLKKKPNIIIFEGRHEIVEPTLYTLSKTVENQ